MHQSSGALSEEEVRYRFGLGLDPRVQSPIQTITLEASKRLACHWLAGRRILAARERHRKKQDFSLVVELLGGMTLPASDSIVICPNNRMSGNADGHFSVDFFVLLSNYETELL
jgi:hypothetical protein